MRVYFAPCGIGLGHVGRSVPIARKLLERNAKVMFSTYSDGIGYIEHEKLPLIKAPSIGFQVKPDGSVDFRQTAVNPGPFLSYFTFLRQVTAELKAIQSFKPDIVVADSRASPLVAARILGMPRICILNQFQVMIPRRKRFLRLARLADYMTLTLVGKVWTSGNIVLIPDFPQPYTISAGNLSIPKSYRKNVRLVGPILSVHSKDLPAEKELRNKLKLPTDKPVILAAISGPTNEKAFLTEILSRILLQFPEDYEVVASLGFPKAKNKPKHRGNVTIYDWIPNRFEYLKACDLVIGRAGHGTLTQCMCYGKPMILIPTSNHTEQLNNAKQAKDFGIAKIILQKDLTKEILLANVKQILENGTPEKAKDVQEKVSSYDGLKNAVKSIVESVKNKQTF